MRISDWSSDVCSSDLLIGQRRDDLGVTHGPMQRRLVPRSPRQPDALTGPAQGPRVHLDQVPHRFALLLRPYSFFAIRSFLSALSSAKIERPPCRERVCQYV